MKNLHFFRHISVILLLCMYFISGIGKISSFHTTAMGMHSKQILSVLPFVLCQMILVCVIVLEIAGPLLILYGISNKKYAHYSYYATIALIIFTVLATALYHSPPIGSHFYLFMKNISIIGGLCAVLTFF